MNRTALAIALVMITAYAIAQPATKQTSPQGPIPLGTPPANAPLAVPAATDPDPAMNNPDKVSWELFVKVNAPAASSGNNNVLFETWATNSDTFKQNPQWPGATPTALVLRPPILPSIGPKKGLQPHVLLGGGEEVRRNKSAFDFIVSNKLYLRTGLKAAFAAGKPITFPVDAIEAKANWIPVTPQVDKSKYHINKTPDGKEYALVSMHIISKQIPNWTWATFEHQDNVGRCDYIDCRDSFGATVTDVKAKTPLGGGYPACTKTSALKQMMSDAKLEPAFANYCLKGSQVDFVTSTGLVTLLGNSVTESGFVPSSSCISCHSRAAVDKNANDLYPPAGFIGSNSANGAPVPTWFWNNPGKPNQSLKGLQTDFVWSLPREAL
jgi:hypothetical protein